MVALRSFAGLVVGATLSVTAGCAQAPAAEDAPVQVVEAPDPVVLSDDPACEYHPALHLTSRVARQGAEIGIVAEEPVGPFAPREIPQELLSGWRVSPAGQIRLDRATRRFTVLPNATPGTDVMIAASFCGKRELTRVIRIVGKDEPVLTGMWKQESVSCEGETPVEPVRELDLNDLGGFSVTYVPFESYRDFWGDAVFDAKAGTLSLKTTGGNRVPSGAKLSGRAKLTAEGKLELDGFLLSDPRGPDDICKYVFRK
jgi:hypothetical protein